MVATSIQRGRPRLGLAPDEAAERVNQTLATPLTGVIPRVTRWPPATTYEPRPRPGHPHESSRGLRARRAPDSCASDGAISTPDAIDLAVASDGHRDDLPDGRLPGGSETELDACFQEVSESRPARIVLGQNAAALVTDQIGVDADLIAAGDANAFGRGHALTAAYYRELGEAWDATQIGWVEQREALVAGWRSFSDPVVDLVSGKIVEKIPVVNVAAELPGVEDVVDGITDGIRDGINSAVYDNLIPEPELEAMTTWRDA